MLQRVLICTFLASSLLVGFCHSVCMAAQPEYAVTQTFALEREKNGVSGELQLSLDTRLTEDIRKQLWGKGDWSSIISRGSKLYDSLSAHPPVNARLQLREMDGKLLAERTLERPLAELKKLGAAGGDNFLLTVDYSTGLGSYAGSATTLLQISNATFHDVAAIAVKTGQKEPIHFMKSLKSDWQISKDSGTVEILSLACRPGPDANNIFLLTYTRYSFDGEKWLAHTRQETGFWESDQPFPPRSAFP